MTESPQVVQLADQPVQTEEAGDLLPLDVQRAAKYKEPIVK